MIRFLWGLGSLGLVVVWGLYAAGKFDIADALMMSLFLIAWPAIMTWRFRQQGKGAVKLDRDGLVIRTGGGWATPSYEWKDIAEVRLSSPSGRWAVDRLWTRVDGAGDDAPFVEVKLKRSRLPLIWDRYGTLWGIRGLGPKTVRLYVTEPEGLVRAAQPFLKRPFNAGRT